MEDPIGRERADEAQDEGQAVEARSSLPAQAAEAQGVGARVAEEVQAVEEEGGALFWWVRDRESAQAPVRRSFEAIGALCAEGAERLDVAPTPRGPWVPVVTGWDYSHPEIGEGAFNPRELLFFLRRMPEAERADFVLRHRGGQRPMEAFLGEGGEVRLLWCYRSSGGEGFVAIDEVGLLPARLEGAGGIIEVSPNPDRVGWSRLTRPAASPAPEVEPAEVEPPEDALLQAMGQGDVEGALGRRVWSWPEPAGWGWALGLWAMHLVYALLGAIRHVELRALVVVPLVVGAWSAIADGQALRHRSEGGFRAADALSVGEARRWLVMGAGLTAGLVVALLPYRFDTAPLELAVAVAVLGTALTSLGIDRVASPWRPCGELFEVGQVLIQPGRAMAFGALVNAAVAASAWWWFVGRTGASPGLVGVCCAAGAAAGWLRPLGALGVQRLWVGWPRGPMDPAAWWWPSSAQEALAEAICRADYVVRLAIHGPAVLSRSGADGSRFGRLLRRALSGEQGIRAQEALVVLAPMGPQNAFGALLSKRLEGLSVRGFGEDVLKDAALARLFEGVRRRLEALSEQGGELAPRHRAWLGGWLDAQAHNTGALTPSRARWSFHVAQATRSALQARGALEDEPAVVRERLLALRQHTERVLRLLQSPSHWGDRLLASRVGARRGWAQRLLLLLCAALCAVAAWGVGG